MPSGRENEIKLPSLDELFSSQQERDEAKLKHIYEIPIDQIDPFPDHPFKVRDDDDMLNLIESIRAQGVLTPCMVRKKKDGRYELISGHRRKRACELLGMDTLRCEIVELSKEQATILMTESNFQRSTILPSEKAFAYKMRLDAMKQWLKTRRKDGTLEENRWSRSLRKRENTLSTHMGYLRSMLGIWEMLIQGSMTMVAQWATCHLDPSQET